MKRITDPMMGFKSIWSAQKLIAGIETMHMVKKGQLHCPGGQAMSAANQFYNLAFLFSKSNATLLDRATLLRHYHYGAGKPRPPIQ